MKGEQCAHSSRPPGHLADGLAHPIETFRGPLAPLITTKRVLSVQVVDGRELVREEDLDVRARIAHVVLDLFGRVAAGECRHQDQPPDSG